MTTPRSLLVVCAAITAACSATHAETVLSHLPPTNGGVMRSSQLWQDPGPDENDLDGDSVCWEDFTLTEATEISHIEWWGSGACELGFRIEIWKQDPGTIAYQPYAIWYYGGVESAEPLITFDTTAYTTSPGPGAQTHYTLELANPIVVPANTPTNPRWFIGITGLTAQPYAQWKWSQGLGTGLKSYQFIRASGYIFWALPEGRAIILENDIVACPADLNGSGNVDAADLAILLGAWGTANAADVNGDGTVNGSDLGILLGAWGGC
ncbi:MAG: hypothetical protein JNL80_08345 [Phycisphaerae bacterium]|nr:hypothetical protein [Phycisphaerae bacterium]